MAAPPTLTVGLTTFRIPPDGPRPDLVAAAAAVERGGAHRIVLPDHVVNGPDVADYPWGRFPTAPDGEWLEPLTVLAAIAAVTSRIRLGTGVLIAPLRPAALLAKTVATLDVLSRGRVDLGVGVGWQEAEFAALGAAFDARGQALTDTIRACRALWEQSPAGISSATVSFDQVYCSPAPDQARLPVWFSGRMTARNVDRIVQLGDGWIPIMGSTVADISDGVQRLAAALTDAGRTIDEITVQSFLPVVRDAAGVMDIQASLSTVPDLVAAGVSDVYVNLRSLDADMADPESACAAVIRALDALTD